MYGWYMFGVMVKSKEDNLMNHLLSPLLFYSFKIFFILKQNLIKLFSLSFSKLSGKTRLAIDSCYGELRKAHLVPSQQVQYVGREVGWISSGDRMIISRGWIIISFYGYILLYTFYLKYNLLFQNAIEIRYHYNNWSSSTLTLIFILINTEWLLMCPWDGWKT